MGRGLSSLQRWILVRARTGQRVYPADVLEGFFGWKPRRPIERFGPTRWTPFGVEEATPAAEVGRIACPSGCHFSKAKIGPKTYRSVMVTLSRAMQRLERRGLMKRLRGGTRIRGRLLCRWVAVEITDQGRELLANSSHPGAKGLTDSESGRAGDGIPIIPLTGSSQGDPAKASRMPQEGRTPPQPDGNPVRSDYALRGPRRRHGRRTSPWMTQEDTL